jgi:hypothetical protein
MHVIVGYFVVDGADVISRHSCKFDACLKCRFGGGDKCFQYRRERVLGSDALEGPMLTDSFWEWTVLRRNNLGWFFLQVEHVCFVDCVAVDFGDVDVASVWEEGAYGAEVEVSVK